MQGQVKYKVKEELGLLLTMIGSTLGTYLHIYISFYILISQIRKHIFLVD